MIEPTTTIVVTVATDLADLVTDRMWQWGVHAVSETDVGNGVAEVSTSVGNDHDAIARARATLDPTWHVELRSLDASVVQVSPEFLSPIWYAPGCVSVPASLHPIAFDGDPFVTVIDPGSAFGLGDHPTTNTSMALLHGLLSGRGMSPDSLLDVGCGTGALAVLAAQMDVPTIRAIDIADAAVEATHRNMHLNNVVGSIVVDTTPVDQLDGSFDIIMANILAPTLVMMADDLERLLAPAGSLIISGILEERHGHVLEALAPLEVVDSMALDGWISIELRHP